MILRGLVVIAFLVATLALSPISFRWLMDDKPDGLLDHLLAFVCGLAVTLPVIFFGFVTAYVGYWIVTGDIF